MVGGVEVGGLAGGEGGVPAGGDVVLEEGVAGVAEVLELDLLDGDDDGVLAPVAVDDEAVVGLVEEVGGAADVVEGGDLEVAAGGSHHLAGVGDEDDQEVEALGELGEGVEDGGDVEGFGGVAHLALDAVVGVDDQGLDASAADEELGAGEDVGDGVAAGVDVEEVLVEVGHGLGELVAGEGALAEGSAGELLDELDGVVGDGGVLGGEVGEFPPVAEVEALGDLVDELALAAAGDAGDDA